MLSILLDNGVLVSYILFLITNPPPWLAFSTSGLHDSLELLHNYTPARPCGKLHVHTKSAKKYFWAAKSAYVH